METVSDQLDREKRAVSYDVYDMTVRQLVDMVTAGEINIAPDYQRHFVWDSERESELIESIYLGIPVPSLYMAANRDGSWEVVDGVQRLSTLVHYCGNEEAIRKIGRKDPLVISSLQKLTSFNKASFSKIPKSTQLYFTLRPVRVTTLNDKSDFGIRYDLFERLNTGGVRLHPQEIRNCVFRGRFRDLLKDLAVDKDYRKVARLPQNEQENATYEELVLRFFAFSELYEMFDHDVGAFLNSYMLERAEAMPAADLIKLFGDVMRRASAALPNGVVRGTRNQTPLNLYEAVVVGLGFALKSGQHVFIERLQDIMNSEDLRKLTTGATNSRKMVTGRINYVRDALLAPQ
jgi:hypothetical protein